MSTLNGAEFNIIKKRTTTINNIIINPIPGSDETLLKHNGYTTEPMVIMGFVYNEKEYDDFKEQFYSDEELTLIIDEDSGLQYIVRGDRGVYEIDGEDDTDNNITFIAQFNLKTPYKESVATITRSKSITTQYQEWSADDDSRDIKTEGNVDAVPDIQIVGSSSSVYEISDPNPLKEPGFETLVHWAYSEVDTNGTLTGGQDSTYEYEGTYCYKLQVIGNMQIGDYARILQNIDLPQIKKIKFMLRWITGNVAPTLKMRIYGGSQQLATYDNPGSSQDTGWVEKELVIDSSWSSLSFRIAPSTVHLTSQDAKCFIDKIVVYTKAPMRAPKVYNINDTNVKCLIANEVLDGAVHRINADGTGTVSLTEDFSDRAYAHTRYDMYEVSYDDVYDEIDIADDGYICWFFDPKYPITDTPILTARVDILSGIPTIQISADASTWYDIDTAIVDDVETEYPLISDGNLALPGRTSFYFRFDCVKASPATCSVVNFELNLNIHTIYAKNPKITKGSSPSTFKIDQESDSNMVCTVVLIFKNRRWI